MTEFVISCISPGCIRQNEHYAACQIQIAIKMIESSANGGNFNFTGVF